MLDQSFSSANFNLIFLKENRKGNFMKSHFTNEYIEKHKEFKALLGNKIALKKTKGILTKEELDKFAVELEQINQEKENIRLDIFQGFSNQILQQQFQFQLHYNPLTEIFSVGNDAPSFYAIKQLQANISNIFKVKQSDRNRIIKQIFNIVSDGFPKIIIKTDIKSFYESIPQERLFNLIEDNTLLSPISKKLIRKIFYAFETQKDTSKIAPKLGVPRGIGISAYLSELYMREIETRIKEMTDLIYYARYVDDIVIIFAPKTISTQGEYLNKIKKIITTDNYLLLKDGSDNEPTKTVEIQFLEGNKTERFDFLGYSFICNKNGAHASDFCIKLELSKNKINKYKTRLKQSVQAYNKDSQYNERMARNLLFSRLKFLTGNFHLNNNKKNIKAGIFYSNAMLCLNKCENVYKNLIDLDKYLAYEIKAIVPPPKIGIDKTNLVTYILAKYSFEKGFKNRKENFYSFNFTEKEESYYFKKYGRATTKFEVIKSIWR